VFSFSFSFRNSFSFHLLFLLIFLVISSCSVEQEKKTFYIRKTNKKVKINGKGNDRAWRGSNELKAFYSPWSNIPIQTTSFKALYDDQWLYFLFQVEDDEIIVSRDKRGEEENPLYSDRVELFFTANETMNPYMTLEIDSEGRLFDAAGVKPGKVDKLWDWPVDAIQIESSKNQHSYTVEGKLNLSSLRSMNLVKTDTIDCGIMRAEYSSGNDVQWITWIDPKTESANFHHPNIFGRLILQ